MRDLIRQILQGYKSLKLEGQDEGYVLFTGQDPDTRQPVSIKIMPRLLAGDPQIASRFEGLARTIRQLNHPNIATVSEVGEQSGLPYVVTRTLEKGHSLAAKLDQPWAVDTAADVVMQVGQALEHAYNKGMVHGSLTPDNVVVQDDGEVVVTDLGLNELIDLVGGSAQLGASPYLAPERMAGQEADARADVYSMAALLYSMLTKQTPQPDQGAIPPPSSHNPDVPPAMDEVLLRALDPDPAKRYPDAKTFLTALGGVSLIPALTKARAVTSKGQCPHCGAKKQTGRFCRKCGQRLDQSPSKAPAKTPARTRARASAKAPPRPPVKKSMLDEPIQVTKVEVGHIEVGKGVELAETVIARPMTVLTGEMDVEFPEPPEVPRLDMESLWPDMGDGPVFAMPDPPEMPAIDWAEIAPPMPKVPVIEDTPLSEERD